ncbi:NAD-dependent epimerase/dehydratase family protein [Gemmatimonas sp.]|uniref:NAD-dependent epimerase/dehydratase family protein n=1 Tax=Gemmatimonas sp. TaxID=1962908 RepID=UPI00356645F6
MTVSQIAVVTGAAGFIGSQLTERLVADGVEVRAVDSFTDYYDQSAKRRNVAAVDESLIFELDLALDDLSSVLEGADVVYHLAGQPGVRGSFGAGFDDYTKWNITATQRLLESSVASGVRRVVYSSSSSVYGAAERFPTTENDLPAPVSPYGVTKLAAEHLCRLYARNFDLSTVSLRYFTVYGPRQRPDMAMHRLIEAALHDGTFHLNGDGSQIRDFTYVQDAVSANRLAAEADVASGSVYNIGGGSSISLASVIDTIEQIVGNRISLERHGSASGDPPRTGADISAARRELGWNPSVTIEDGLGAQVEWHRNLFG